MTKADIIVLGAGIVGVSTAFHLRRRGFSVCLVDRGHPGEGASFGNAGIVERNGFVPPLFPDRLSSLLQVALHQSTAVSYSPATLWNLRAWLKAFRRNSEADKVHHYAWTMASLRKLVLEEHRTLSQACSSQRFYRSSGWLHLYRSSKGYSEGEDERHYARIFGVDYHELSSEELPLVEPGLSGRGLSGVFWPETMSVSNPAAVVEAVWRTFIQEGGQFFRGDAKRLRRHRASWSLKTLRGEIFADAVVVALGPWSDDLTALFGDRFPLAVKRGYHVHFRPSSGGSLSRPVVDIENGFVLTPMDKGIRLTTGVDLSPMDAPPNETQVRRATVKAREIFRLGKKDIGQVWAGGRPCLPDSLPVLGASPSTPGLWYNFGHGHSGFTLGPLTGRMLAETIAGQEPCAEAAALSPARFLV
ncbi:FAD-dependent oxidoreductase [Roseibium aquae]|uniref:FAD-dependent oxidoreductase n=1 Tax=Roseibium aquae TaxID=1323746 RepID=A0A916TMT5_9HYPH|nr:FAD-binding oxidoreductase [Roseibium aquae]GGB59219.1 FAD-dependent oxidoreductase [Roseibium aquae]